MSKKFYSYQIHAINAQERLKSITKEMKKIKKNTIPGEDYHGTAI